MGPFLYQYFHNETNDRTEKGLVQIPKDEKDWPEGWKRIEYKKYILFRPVELPRIDSGLFSLLSRRQSRGNITHNRVTLSVLSQILRCGYGMQQSNAIGERSENRTVPSGGKLYPLEIYPILFKDIEGCRTGIYHYGVREHTLEPITFDSFTPDEIRSIVYEQWLAGLTGMICISAVFNRTTAKYGSRGYRYILLEAGHVGQNMILAGVENQVSIIPIGGANEIDFERKIGLMDTNERIVYTLFF